jgi:hypothetical protein
LLAKFKGAERGEEKKRMLLLLMRPLVCFFFFYTLHVHYMVRDSNGGCGPIIWGLHTHTLRAALH